MEVKRILGKLGGLSIFLAYNTNVDVISHVDRKFEELFSEKDAKKARKRDIELLEDRIDLLGAVFNCMKKGEGNEIQIKNDELKNWIERKLSGGEKRLGGQAGIMSNLLSKLGCETVLYTTNLSREQAELFDKNENLTFPYLDNGELNFSHPSELWQDIDTKKNWILEFFKDQELFGVRANTNSRFIASSPYTKENLEMGQLERKVDELAKNMDCMILAGYHNLLEKYPDGTTWREHLDSAKEFLRRAKKANPDLKIQIEFSAIHRRNLRKTILKEVVPLADVLSFDTNELDLILKDIKIGGRTPEPDEPYRMSETLREITKELDIDAVSIHTHHYYMSVSRDYIDPRPIKKGFKFARNAAWTVASGRELRPENLELAEEVKPSERGREHRRSLADSLGDEKFSSSGIHRNEFDIVLVPNKIYDDPELTVGLGDVISSTSFAVENALG